MGKREICIVVLLYSLIGVGLAGHGLSWFRLHPPIEVVDPDPDPELEPEPVHIRDELVDVFRSQIGIRQTGNNTGPEIDMYLAAVGLDPGYAWCGAFAGWGYLELNLCIPNGAAWTPSWFPESNTIPAVEALRGDVGGIYFQSLQRIAHIVVFEQDWNNAGNMITTIEGNTNDTGSRTGDGVYRKYRMKGQIYRTANWVDADC